MAELDRCRDVRTADALLAANQVPVTSQAQGKASLDASMTAVTRLVASDVSYRAELSAASHDPCRRIVGLDVDAAIRHHLLMETSFGWCQVRRHGVGPLRRATGLDSRPSVQMMSRWLYGLAPIVLAVVTTGCDSASQTPDSAIVRLPASSPVAGTLPPLVVDLDRSDVLEQLRTRNPEHFRKVSEILAGLPTRSGAEVATWVNVAYDAKDFELGSIYLVSLPPKQQLAFTLDGIRYRATVIQPGALHPTPQAVKH